MKNDLTRLGALRTALQFVWNRLASRRSAAVGGCSQVEPLLLKMESRLSLFTIWRPDCSRCYPTAILPALKIQLWEGRGPCKWHEARVRSPGELSRSFSFCVRVPARGDFSPGWMGTAPPLYRQPLARLFSLVNFSLSLGNEQTQRFYPYMGRSARGPVFTVWSDNRGQCEGARVISLNNFLPPFVCRCWVLACVLVLALERFYLWFF